MIPVSVHSESVYGTPVLASVSSRTSSPMPSKRTSSANTVLTLRKFKVFIEDTPIVHGIDLDIRAGEVHAIMGPNGSGKSTLVNALMGHPKYRTEGSARFFGKELADLSPDQRAQAGMFLAFQYPKEIAGVTVRQFLLAAYEAQMRARNPKHARTSPVQFRTMLQQTMRQLHMDPVFADRSVNHGFSGGEKKKAEILQLTILRPSLALLDETDSGLDVDALRIVADGVNAQRSRAFSAILVTHYARILEYIVPDRVHVMVRGNIAESGGADFARMLEREGYERFTGKAPSKLRLEV